QPLASEKGITLSCQRSETGASLVCDRERLLQVFANLGGNAVKFTPRKGQVAIGVERRQNGMRFWVSDTGPGIPPAHLKHLFNRFWQMKETAKSGHGLGLHICKGIVEAHDGTIAAESVEGQGSTFSFMLPLPEARQLRRA